MSLFGTFLTFYEAIFCASLFLSVISLWIFSSHISAVFICIACLLGALFHLIDGVGLLSLIFITFIIQQYYQESKNHLKKILLGGMIIIGVGGPIYYLHFTPGFIDFPLIETIYFSSDSTSYSYYLKPYQILTALILLFFGRHSLNRTVQEWGIALRAIPLPLCLLTIILIGSALAFHYVRLDPKLPLIFSLWAAINLLFVCMAEEAFFRGFLQKEFMTALTSVRGGNWIALGSAACLFGGAHYRGGLTYVILSFLAGLGYGYAYLKSKKIESSILLHFWVNAIHFIGFSYPTLNHSILR